MARILGIDPGLQRTGFGVVDRDGNRLVYVASGVIRTDRAAGLGERLRTIADGITSIVRDTMPDCAVVELVFVNANPRSTLLLGQARGAAITGAATSGLPLHEYTPTQVKQATAGSGRATKEQVQSMVVRLLGLDGRPQADAADALACAITHAHAGEGLERLHAAAAGGRRAGGRGLRLRGGRLA